MMRPDDIVAPLYAVGGETEDGGWFMEMFHNPDRHWPPCRVYWGSHGCARPLGHEGEHWCDCCECADHARDHEEEGCVAGPPYYGPDTRFYGEGVESDTDPVEMEIRIFDPESEEPPSFGGRLSQDLDPEAEAR